MKLNHFKRSPISILSFILFTFLLSYLIIGHAEIAIVATTLSTWIFMMPRLTWERSLYKFKMPKFLKKGDFINKIISLIIPLTMWIIYAVLMRNQTIMKNDILGLLLVLMPIIPAGIQYFILVKSDAAMDWVMPFIMAILTFFGCEFITGSLMSTIKIMFPMFFGGAIAITQLWGILFEILFIYGLYKLIAMIFPGRTLASLLTTGLYSFIAMVQTAYMQNLGFSFKLSDARNIKQFIAIVKILLFNEPIPMQLLISGVAVIFVTTMIVYLLNKWSTTYDMKERTTGAIIGIVVVAICVFGISCVKNYANQNNFEIFNGMNEGLIAEIKETNTYSEDFLNKVDKEFINFGWKEIEVEGEKTETAPKTESTTPTGTAETNETEPTVAEQST